MCYSEDIVASKNCIACKSPYNFLTGCKNSFYNISCEEHGCCNIHENCILCDGA